jgi:ribulose-phosphate 3-epimerase
MAPELIPALLCENETSFRDRLMLLEQEVPWVQIDVLDGTLYPNQSWADPNIVSAWDIHPSLELHLMVQDPEFIIDQWKNSLNFKRAIWHIEANIDHAALIQKVHNMGREVGLAMAPNTPLEALTPYLENIDRVLILGVEPGWSGQTLIPKTLEKVQALKTRSPHPVIEFDGGVTDETLEGIIQAGAESICVASLIFKHPPVVERIRAIRAKLEKTFV